MGELLGVGNCELSRAGLKLAAVAEAVAGREEDAIGTLVVSIVKGMGATQL